MSQILCIDITDLDGGTVATVQFPNPNDLTNFNVIVSPDSGCWSGAQYHFTFVVPALYPHEPPKVTCNTKIYHPNINLAGAVCLNILREDWKPVLDINAVIYGLIYLYYEPNPDDPLNREAADLYRTDKAQVKLFISPCPEAHSAKPPIILTLAAYFLLISHRPFNFLFQFIDNSLTVRQGGEAYSART